MSSAVVEIEVPVEETEAYQELMTRAGRRTGKIPAGADGPPRAGVCAGPRMADAGRGDGRGAAPARGGPEG